ncbi:MAG: bifunctional [glutamine synthetase] adenylyltransferase/[glutamine synthetase]-adenylyl-L-tyrosine phosphorylase [Actinobacteria bacterium]|nr:bifunctional [glutamine synthetase] adenylyltransferase/[glutamine synthetase]-adenylyl-L-tyrosine phosphorylase [Actinomycetota bacterium]
MRETPPIRAELARRGFLDTGRAEGFLASPVFEGMDPQVLLGDLSATADPDAALLNLLRLLEAPGGGAATALGAQRWHSLLRVLGASQYFADLLVADTTLLDALGGRPVDEHFSVVYQRVDDVVRPFTRQEHALGAAVVALRRHYRRELLGIVVADLDAAAASPNGARDIMPAVSRAMANLAGATLHGALVLARHRHPEADPYPFTIIAMGKTGAEELNYISDVDVIHVCEGDDEAAAVAATTSLATTVMRIVSEAGPEPPLWPLDAGLRPEGKDGPLVRTLDSHVAYYRRWAHTWEFQALLKARPVAGDVDLGNRYVAATNPLVWSAVERENFVEDSQAMRRRVEDHVRARDAERQLKLGKGGLRDVEFTVQLLQLVHGRTDPSLRVRGTLDALAALAAGGYVGRDEARELGECYRFLRALEHRIQLHRMRRSHVVPSRKEDLRRLSRLLGVEDVEREWVTTRRRVRELHEAIFYRPLLPLTARLTPQDIALDPGAALARLAAIGYRDPAGAMRHMAVLTEGVSRRSTIQRHLLPVMLGWFAEAPDPDAGLLAFRKLSEELGRTHWYLKLLRDSGTAGERLAHVLASSAYAADAMTRLPESVQWLAHEDGLAPRTRDALLRELDSMLLRRDDQDEGAEAARYLRRREVTRAALGDVLDGVDPARAAMITDAADVAVIGALRVARHVARRAAGLAEGAPDPARFAIIAMGRMGGREMAYASDADVMFVYEAAGEEQPALEFAMKLATGVRAVLTQPGPEPPLALDADLRPEGRRGPLVRSLAAYAEYYDRWVEPWECQALLRARPIAGDEDLLARFTALIDPVRYREGGLDAAALTSLRRMKARVEAERMPRGVPPNRHLKLGRGGLTDVEFTIQLLQLQLAHQHPALRTTRTVAALEAAWRAGALSAEDFVALRSAWEFASRVRDAIMLVTGRPQKSDVLPRVGRDLSLVSRLLGYPPGASLDFEEDYLRAARHARRVVEAVFFS